MDFILNAQVNASNEAARGTREREDSWQDFSQQSAAATRQQMSRHEAGRRRLKSRLHLFTSKTERVNPSPPSTLNHHVYTLGRLRLLSHSLDSLIQHRTHSDSTITK
jgi:hypothetical protein